MKDADARPPVFDILVLLLHFPLPLAISMTMDGRADGYFISHICCLLPASIPLSAYTSFVSARRLGMPPP